jgi:DNA-binding NarL/FixJ family response regulator
MELSRAMNTAIRLMLVTGEDRSRMRLAAAIAADSRLMLVDCVASSLRALQRLALVRPDVLLVGTGPADIDAAAFVRDARRALATCELIALVREGDEEAALECMAAGAAGCVSHACEAADLAAYLLQLRAGTSPVPSAVMQRLLERLRGATRAQAQPAPAGPGITPREVEVLRMISSGCSYEEAGERLGISLHTVATHIKSAYRKLEVHSAGAAIMRAVELNIIGAAAR